MLNRIFFLVAALVIGMSLSACSDAGTPTPAPAKVEAKVQESAPAVAPAGQGYIEIAQPVRTAHPDKIEVTEVFWYGCSHCFHFEPMVKAWAKKLPADVDFRPSPAMWNPLMVVHAQLFYTAETLGVLDQVHQLIFDEINLRNNRLSDEDSMAKLLQEAAGVDPEKFKKTFNSFGVKSQVKQADSRARSYGIAGTPELIVNGKYRITGRSAGGHTEMLKVAEQLIAKERAAMAK
ncbi:thiol:disulfide interchange protein DsbA/DsbL [Spongiibacter sp. KMU-158]|uniref:Thiol:disulfide interchange protein DsbA n=1 Tax=Spongiibacter pelagi TaxID=2760804 RepID=A0A927C0C0_9GAMM|nr:thiol:disulfide interchange protein DsbA/DsbL [Spongiibacter pelagi]MBD2857547.1 thiol:disulfide interchange protein DsbA/DsbL [Spongiibacter pelagi]